MDRFDWLEIEHESPSTPRTRVQRQAPTDGPTFYQAARRMRRGGHFRQAADFYGRAIGFDDHHYAARAELVDTLIRDNRFAEADRESAAALANYGQVRMLYAGRGLALAHLGRFQEAHQHAETALDAEATWYAHGVYAEVCLKMSPDNRGLAFQHLERALELAEDLWDPYFMGGCMLWDAGWPTLAAGYFSEACHRDPRAVVGWLCLGECFHALRLYDQALFYFQKATEVEPTHEIALARQKKCVPLLWGLTRVFAPRDLRRRWNKEFDKMAW